MKTRNSITSNDHVEKDILSFLRARSSLLDRLLNWVTDRFKKIRIHNESFNSIIITLNYNGTIIEANNQFCELGDYTQKELSGLFINELMNPVDNDEHSFWQKILSKDVWKGEVCLKTKNGKSKWLWMNIAPTLLPGSNQHGYVAVAYNITELKLTSDDQKRITQNQSSEETSSLSPHEHIHSFTISIPKNKINGDFSVVRITINNSTFILADSTGDTALFPYFKEGFLNSIQNILNKSFTNINLLCNEMRSHVGSLYRSNTTSSHFKLSHVALCNIDHHELNLNYSLLGLRGLIIRNGVEIELERHRVGIFKGLDLNSCNTSIKTFQLQKGDVIFLYTNGITNQFGGSKNKKFGKKRLINLLKECYSLSVKKQEKLLQSALFRWQGSNIQTDDMSLMAIKID
jgi:PAS domain S-box-containing protein